MVAKQHLRYTAAMNNAPTKNCASKYSAQHLLTLRSYAPETDRHHHDYHQLVLPIQGVLSLEIDAKGKQLATQEAAVITAGENHGFSAPQNNRFVVADVPTHTAPELPQLPRFIKLTPPLISYTGFLNVQLQSTDASACSQTSQSSQHQMLQLLIQLPLEQAGKPVQLDRRLAAACDYLERFYAQKITLTAVAQHAAISPRQLRELFRHSLGTTPQQHLIDIRMQKARQLLEMGEHSVQQTADAVGYTNLAAFSDRFHRQFGLAPSHFRRSHKAQRRITKV